MQHLRRRVAAFRKRGIPGLGVREVCLLNPFSPQNKPQRTHLLHTDPAFAKAVEALGSADELEALPSDGLPSTESDPGR